MHMISHHLNLEHLSVALFAQRDDEVPERCGDRGDQYLASIFGAPHNVVLAAERYVTIGAITEHLYSILPRADYFYKVPNKSLARRYPYS